MVNARILGAVFIGLAASCASSAFALATEQFGQGPIEPSPDWPQGIVELLQSPGRVYSTWVNGDEQFYYRGNTEQFNDFLNKFAAVKTPAHRLAVEKRFNQVRSLEGKTSMRYDWKLSVPSGLYLAKLKDQKPDQPEQAYPLLEISIHSDGIDFDEIVLPEAVKILEPQGRATDLVRFRQRQLEKAKQWSTAAIKWQQFVQPLLARVRQEEKDPTRQCVEVKSRLISDYLPQYKIYVIETSRVGRSSIFAVSMKGQITDLGDGRWSSPGPNQPFRNEKISKFLTEQWITISNPDAAVAVAKLIEELSFTPRQVMNLKTNTKGLAVFDKRILRSLLDKDLNWKYTAQRKDDYWLISQEYIGPPASVLKQPQWQLFVDQASRLVDVRHQ